MTAYNAIPTVYKGIRFRSRLEARWAAFFDAVGWPWTYEAIDLSRYIPDFILPFEASVMLVEVKPALALHELEEHRGKVERSGWDGEVVLVGAAPFQDDRWRHPILGLMRDHTEGVLRDPADGWGYGLLGLCGEHMGIGLCHATIGYDCRVCGSGGADPLAVPERHVVEAWGRACNAVQWRPTPS